MARGHFGMGGDTRFDVQISSIGLEETDAPLRRSTPPIDASKTPVR